MDQRLGLLCVQRGTFTVLATLRRPRRATVSHRWVWDCLSLVVGLRLQDAGVGAGEAAASPLSKSPWVVVVGKSVVSAACQTPGEGRGWRGQPGDPSQ
jgi:hypothetical protein